VLAALSPNHELGARNSALVRLLLDGGLCLGEACQLRLQDVDWQTGRVHIRWETAKRRKERVTHIGDGTLHALRRYVDRFRPGTTLEELFIDQDGGPLTTNAVQCVLRRLRLKLGMNKLSAHQFRRTWATNFRRMGVGDLYDLQREGGWEDLSVPQRFYVDVTDGTERKVSVMDRWETAARKRDRSHPVQVVNPVQEVQVVVDASGSRKTAPRTGGNGAKKRV
jgi:integrase